MGGKGKGGCMGPWQLVGLGLETNDGRWRKGYSFLKHFPYPPPEKKPNKEKREKIGITWFGKKINLV